MSMLAVSCGNAKGDAAKTDSAATAAPAPVKDTITAAPAKPDTTAAAPAAPAADAKKEEKKK